MSDLYIANKCGDGYSSGDRIVVTNWYNQCSLTLVKTLFLNQDRGKLICNVNMCDLDVHCCNSVQVGAHGETSDDNEINITIDNNPIVKSTNKNTIKNKVIDSNGNGNNGNNGNNDNNGNNGDK